MPVTLSTPSTPLFGGFPGFPVSPGTPGRSALERTRSIGPNSVHLGRSHSRAQSISTNGAHSRGQSFSSNMTMQSPAPITGSEMAWSEIQNRCVYMIRIRRSTDWHRTFCKWYIIQWRKLTLG